LNTPKTQTIDPTDTTFYDFLESLPPEKPPVPSKKKTPRVPAAHEHGINVNFCKNPNCYNFGIPVEEAAYKGKGAVNRYTVVGSGKNLPAARCNNCGEIFPLKSNNGVFEEAWRITGETFHEPSCPDQDCPNHRVGISNKNSYYSLGLTKAGSQRYRCREAGCNKIFSVKPSGIDPTARHQQGAKNTLLLELLINKMPLRRICEVAKVAPRVLYERIDFFYEQALAVLAHYESKLPTLPIKRLYIGVDRQEYAINWSRREDKKNVILSAVAAADNLTGYVFGMHTNFDPIVSAKKVEEYNLLTGDDMLPAPHRRFARLWVQKDYEAALLESNNRKPAGSLAAAIKNTYDQTNKRSDVEASEVIDEDKALPDYGMLVHAEYTLYGSFLRMAKLFQGTEKVRFFLDQDSGIRSSCFAAFADRIKARTVDAFYVSITKDQTVDVKRKLVGEAELVFKEIAASNPKLDKDGVKLLMLTNEIQAAKQIGQWKDRWVMHPLPTISEAEKASCFLTDMGDYTIEHQAWLHNKASLHAVDSWFNRVRRRNAMLERPIKSASNLGRTYYAYSAYKPEQVAKLLTILRVCHNYIWQPADQKKPKGAKKPVTPVPKIPKKSPAMKLGLIDRFLTYEELINFRK
jgi:hypothetical protein